MPNQSRAMAKKITTCLFVPLVFVVSVIGLFFASTDPSTWPQKTTHLGVSDTKLMPAASTIWCESVVLTSSEHDFVVQKLTETPAVDRLSLRRQVLELSTRLDRRRLNKFERTFYLLPGSVIRIIVCATNKQAHLHVYRGAVTRECLNFATQSSESEEESEEEEEYKGSWTLGYGGDFSAVLHPKCPPTLKSEDVPVSEKDFHSMDCIDSSTRAVNINVTSPGNYAVVLTNDGFGSNDVRLRLILDRAIYRTRDATSDIQTCTTLSPCAVPLTFASRERILITIPSDPESGKTAYAIRSQCRPRIAVFAFLIVLLPVVLFVIVAFFVRGGRRGSTSRYQAARQLVNRASSSNAEDTRWRNFVSPLIPPEDNSDRVSSGLSEDVSGYVICPDSIVGGAANSQCFDGEPPPYECVFDSPPPSYSSLCPLAKEAAPQNRLA